MTELQLKNKQWYQQGAGPRFIEAENEELTQIISKLYGYHLLFLGDPNLSRLASSSLIKHQILIHNHNDIEPSPMSLLVSDLESIPLRNDSVDVVVLSHTLETATHPHEILREAHRILIPEGHIVITGLNPISMWGAWLHTQRTLGKTSNKGKMITKGRICDWLKLLSFQLTEEKTFFFRPPINHEKTFQKLAFLEQWGHRAWPLFAGGYALVAVKRQIPLTAIRSKWRKQSIWQPDNALPKPTTTVNNNTEE